MLTFTFLLPAYVNIYILLPLYVLCKAFWVETLGLLVTSVLLHNKYNSV